MIEQALTHVVDFLGAHQGWAIVFAFLVAFGEALLIVGLFVPSTVVLVGIGTLVGLGKMPFLPVFAAAVLGATLGDALSFWAGVHWKDQIKGFWPFSRYKVLIETGESFIARHGGKSIFLVRFIPGIKAVVPTIAGMMGMSALRFSVVNIVSAFFWAGVHLLPAMAFARGFQVATAANPRFLALAGLCVLAVGLAWLTVHLARAVLIPVANWGRLRLALVIEHQGVQGGALARLLRNHNGALETAALVGLALSGFAGFGLLLGAVVFDPNLSLADAAIGQFVQGLRTDWATSGMVAITMLGDTAVLVPVAAALIGVLLWYRHWVLAGTTLAAALISAVFVPMFKTLLHRARPIELYHGADGFSFPSGHSTLSTVIFGMLALFVAQAVPARFRSWIYTSFACLIALIAVSRIYVQAHWPSDVAAGLLFGGSVVTLMALILSARVVAVPRWVFGMLLAGIGFGIIPVHLWAGYSAAYASYDVVTVPTVLASADWLAKGWQNLPAKRILLNGKAGEAMLVQTTLPLDQVVARLEAAGWQPTPDSLSPDLLAAMMPTRQTLADHAPWPMTHFGRTSLATMTRIDPGVQSRRLVLRIWASDVVVQDGLSKAPLLLVSLTADVLDPVAFGFAKLEVAALPPAQITVERAALALALPRSIVPLSSGLAPILVQR